MNGRLALIKSQLLLSNYVSCLLAALSWLSAEWDISGSLPGIRAIPLHWAWTQFSIMGISESSWGSREVTLEFSWVNPADWVLFQSGDSEPKAGGDHGGVGFMEDPQSPTPLQAPHKSIWKNVYNSCSIFASTWQNSATWWSHRAKNILFSPHVQVFIPHVQLSLSIFISYSFNISFYIYTFLYFQLLLDFFCMYSSFYSTCSSFIQHIWSLDFTLLPRFGCIYSSFTYFQFSSHKGKKTENFCNFCIYTGFFVYIDISFQILNFHSVY